MKYIDAEKLKKAIEDKGLDCSFALKMERLNTLALIDSLEQEQPDANGLEEAAEEWCKINNKGIALCADKKSHYLAEGVDAFIAGAEWMAKQKEQKPVEYLSKDKVYTIMTKLTELSTSDLIPLNSDEYKKINEITSDVRSLLDYPIGQKPVDYAEELKKCKDNPLYFYDKYVKVKQKPAEWSKED